MRGVVVIPALNEEQNIARIISEVSVFSEVIVVDDGSMDKTSSVAEKSGANVLRLSENQGYDYALCEGFNFARELGYEFFVTFDADGQLSIAELKNACEILANSKAELVIGVRADIGRWSERLFNFWVKRRFDVGDILCGLKGYSKTLYDEYGKFTYAKSVGTELALFGLKQKYSLVVLPATVVDRHGKSRFGGGIRGHARILAAMLRWQFRW